MKLLLLDWAACGDDLQPDVFRSFGEVIDRGVVTTEERFLQIAREEEVRDCEILLCNKAPVTAAVIDALPNLSYVGVFATGCNNIDLVYAARRGVTVCNVPGYSTEAVAQTVFSLILQIAGSTGAYTEDTRRGKWVGYPIFSMYVHPMEELCGKTLGVFGYGAIGKRVAQIADAFGMRVLVCSRTIKPDCPFKQVGREELLRQSDYLSLNAPLTPLTERFICQETLDVMKPGAVLINTSRGGLVDEKALAQALQSGKLKAAGLDVLQKEPMAPDCPLLGISNCYITPHVAWAPKETRRRLVDVAADNVARFLAGSPVNVVT